MTGASSKRSPFTYFMLVFVLSVPFWIVGAVAGTALPLPMHLPASALQAFCPLVAALILVYREERLAGVKGLLWRLVDIRRIISAVWFVPMFVTVPTIYVLAYYAMRLMGRPLPDQRLSLLAVPVLLVVFFVAAAGEEAGWTGYATDAMRGRWSALTNAILIGSVWGLFHVVADIQAHRGLEWVVWQRAVYDVALRILIVWLYNNAGYSLFAAVVMHDTDNVSVSLFPAGGSHYDPAFTGVIAAFTAVVVTLGWGAKTLNRFRYGRRGITAPGAWLRG